MSGFYMSRHVEREILSALIDGELTADERRMVHEHLQECAACRETVEEFTQIHGLVGELPRLVAPESFVTEVVERPRRRPAPTRIASAALSGRRRWVALGAAATVLGISLAGLFVSPPADEAPVSAFIERHVSTHGGVEPGAQVLFAVNGH
jgi:anti-sigma factor RsiW